MRRIALLTVAALLSLVLTGCGGALGHDSPTQIRLESTGGTADLTNLHPIVSPNNGSATSAAAVSDTQSQSWATYLTNTGFKELDFTTSSTQVPYFFYVQNSLGTDQQVRVRIYMDGNLKFDHVVMVAANTTTQENTIFRNNVQNP